MTNISNKPLVTICPTGAREVAPAIMHAAERGALREDVRAARAGLITHITPCGKLSATAPRPPVDVKAILAERAREAAEKKAIQAYTRMEYARIMRGE